MLIALITTEGLAVEGDFYLAELIKLQTLYLPDRDSSSTFKPDASHGCAPRLTLVYPGGARTSQGCALERTIIQLESVESRYCVKYVTWMIFTTIVLDSSAIFYVPSVG
jgi:hypothetical protein